MPLMYFYYTAPQEANTWINIDSVLQLKLQAAAKHMSQFEPAITKYRPDWDPADWAKVEREMTSEQSKKDGHVVEVFRKATGFNQE